MILTNVSHFGTPRHDFTPMPDFDERFALEGYRPHLMAGPPLAHNNVPGQAPGRYGEAERMGKYT